MNIKDLVPYLDDKALKVCLASDAFIVPFNPYSSIFPFRTTFRGFDIDLAKMVAEVGIRVTVPQLEGTNKKEVILQKHFDLSNPLVLFIVGIPFSLLIGVISGLIVYLVTKGKAPDILIVKLTEQGEVDACYDQTGNIVSGDKAQAIISNIRTAPFYTSPNQNSERPVPIHFEHTSQVVGWGETGLNKQGLFIKNVIIDDDTTWQLIKSGKLVGFSIGGIAKKYLCSICHKNYFTCKHIKGQYYNGKEAFCEIKSLDLAEISIVSDPTNVDARIQEVKTQFRSQNA